MEQLLTNTLSKHVATPLILLLLMLMFGFSQLVSCASVKFKHPNGEIIVDAEFIEKELKWLLRHQNIEFLKDGELEAVQSFSGAKSEEDAYKHNSGSNGHLLVPVDVPPPRVIGGSSGLMFFATGDDENRSLNSGELFYVAIPVRRDRLLENLSAHLSSDHKIPETIRFRGHIAKLVPVPTAATEATAATGFSANCTVQ